MKRKIWQLTALLLSVLLLTGCASATTEPRPNTEKTTGMGFYFDTVVTVTLYGAPEGLMQEIWTACEKYEKMLSKTVPDSDVSRINAAKGVPVAVDPETYEILRRARDISAMTGGAFSVTIAPLMAMWDFTGGTNRMPEEAERIAALPLVDDSRITLHDDGTVSLPAGMQIDLGGIAKGYIADQVAELVRGRVHGATLSFGGNVYVVGDKSDGSAFNVGLQDPFTGTGTALGVILTKNCSVVTSGTYERGFDLDGVRYHHILDPKTGLPAWTDLTSATLVMTSSMDADALATACIVLGSDAALDMLNGLGFDALLIRHDGTILATDDFQERHSFYLLEK